MECNVKCDPSDTTESVSTTLPASTTELMTTDTPTDIDEATTSDGIFFPSTTGDYSTTTSSSSCTCYVYGSWQIESDCEVNEDNECARTLSRSCMGPCNQLEELILSCYADACGDSWTTWSPWTPCLCESTHTFRSRCDLSDGEADGIPGGEALPFEECAADDSEQAECDIVQCGTVTTTATAPMEQKTIIIIASSVAAGIALIIIIVVTVVCCKKSNAA